MIVDSAWLREFLGLTVGSGSDSFPTPYQEMSHSLAPTRIDFLFSKPSCSNSCTILKMSIPDADQTHVAPFLLPAVHLFLTVLKSSWTFNVCELVDWNQIQLCPVSAWKISLLRRRSRRFLPSTAPMIENQIAFCNIPGSELARQELCSAYPLHSWTVSELQSDMQPPTPITTATTDGGWRYVERLRQNVLPHPCMQISFWTVLH